MTKEEMIEIHHQIVKMLYSLNRDNFDDWMFTNVRPSSPMHPDGMFSNIEEYQEFMRMTFDNKSKS